MIWVWLWTDIMVWGLVASFAGLGWHLSRSPQVLQQWYRIFKSKIAMISAVILLFYLAIALIDSLHFKLALPAASSETNSATTSSKIQYSSQVTSLLDLAFGQIKSQTERTYAAPFALNEHSRTIVKNEAGEVEQVFLPLKHSGAHLADKNQQLKDIAVKSVQAVFASLLLGLLAISLHVFWRAFAHKTSFLAQADLVVRNQTELPWRAAYLTFLIVLSLLAIVFYLGHFYPVFGTDKVGSDVLYQSFKSIRTGVLIGVLTTLITLPLALILGISAGLFKGWIDDVIQYIYTTLNSIPGILLIAASVLVMQTIMNNHPEWFSSATERADFRLLVLVLILGLTSWTGLCRLLRAETLKISQVEYVTAARAFGVSRFKIILRHILPNVMHLVLIAVVLDFSALVLAEAVLSYVGVGVDPTMHSWGNMINQARLEMAREPMVWWPLLSAFILMFVLVLAANLFSDRVQKVLDPKNN